MSEPYTPPPPPPTYAPPPPPTGGGTASPNRGIMIVLSYLWLLALIPLLTEKEDREVQWHAKHGLVLMAVEIAAMILISILFSVVAFFDFGCGGCVVQWVLSVAIFVVHILCIVKGLNGQRFIIPGVSQYADRF
jgi:uncharacterized membrane protein